MNLKLKRIAPLQAGKILGVFYALISLLFVPFMLFFMAMGSLVSRNQPNAAPFPLMFGMGIGFMVFLPVLYGIMGFIFGALSAWIYNLLAKWLGGFELEFESSAPPPVT
ncbi:MAG: hypothetical protein JWQ62_154 [Lacunisphaera sp.]|nr:hypothetical protein [Lacunisphaera sp.]